MSAEALRLGIWLAIGLGGLLVVAGAIWLIRRRRAGDGGVSRALAGIAVDSIRDVLVPDGMGGVIHVEHLLLTARGVVVINVKPYTGIVFASDGMKEWTVIRNGSRSVIANPIGALYDRVAAVKQLVRDIDVHGHLLFPDGADFSKGQPQAVVLPAALLAAYPKPEGGDRERVTTAFQPYWEKLRAAVEAAQDGR